MARHYIKLLNRLQEYAEKVRPDEASWQRAVFNDLTAGGRELRAVPLGDAGKGPVVGLCGDYYFCEAVTDVHREDALFVFRIESAERRLPRVPPVSYQAEFLYLSKESPPQGSLDPVATLIELAGAAAPEASADKADVGGSADAPGVARPSEQLVRLLQQVPDGLRRLWRPRPVSADNGEETPESGPRELLAALGRIWSRYRLDRHVDVPPRHAGLLKQIIRPRELKSQTRRQLLAHFNVALLNTLVRERSHTRESLEHLLVQLAALDLSAAVRAQVWARMLGGLSPTRLRRELHDVADVLAALQQEAVDHYAGAIKEALAMVAERSGDHRLASLAEEADSEGVPLAFLARWARRLEYGPDSGPGEDDPSAEGSRALPTRVAAGQERSASGCATGAAADEHDPQAAEETDEQGSEPREPDPFERWVLRLRVPDEEQLAHVVAELEVGLRDALPHGATAPDTVEGVQQLVRRLRLLQADLATWLQTLPDPELLQSDLDEARAACAEAQPVLGELLELLVRQRVTPAEVVEIAEIMRHDERLRRLPRWLWEPPEPPEPADLPSEVDLPRSAADRGPARRCLALLLPEMRQRIQGVLARIDELGEDALPVLAQLPPPSGGPDLEGHLDGALEQLRSTQRALKQLPEEHRGWVGLALRSGVSLNEVLRSAHRLDGLRHRVGPQLFEQIVERAGKATTQREREDLIAGYERAVAAFEDLLETARDARIEQLDRWLAGRPSQTQAATPRSEGRSPGPELEHNWVDASGRRVPLVFHPHGDPGRPYGVVEAPLVVQIDLPRDLDLRLQLDMKTDQRKGWPRDWEAPSPELLHLSRFAWRAGGGGAYHFSFKLRVPMREPRSDAEPLEFVLRAVDASTGAALTPPKRLRWPGVVTSAEQISFDWQDGINPQYVLQHPIGPQHDSERILRRVSAGNSFAVIAPRRFGKSTLVEYLRADAEEAGLLVLKSVLCTSYHDGSSLDYHSLWDAVSAELQRRLGTPLAGPLQDGLPGPDAFDRALQVAGARGRQSIVLLLDEAQLFFPRERGYLLGDRLKDLLERHWGRRDRQGGASLVLGLTGLPSLLSRAGTNLMALLRPVERTELRERDLQQLVLGVTRKRLHTTREARLRLAERAGNLFVLRTLLDRLVEQLNEHQRHWASWDDVVHVEADLKRSLAAGREQNLASYLRDVLNEGDNVNHWQPKPCYPLAVALARAERDGARDPVSRQRRAQRLLTRWCRQIQSEHGNRLVYTDDCLAEHERTLRDLGVLDDSGFRSELLAAWLWGASRHFPDDDADRRALLRGAVERIRIPEGLEPVHEGGAGKVFRFTDEGAEYALRKVRLTDEGERRIFLELVHTLHRLKNRVHSSDEGADAIFELRDIGLADEDDDLGIGIYRWIDGLHLGKKLGQLNAPLVANLGLKLARGVKLLHRHDILHRDICPRNVIFSEAGSKPVLVDFGLARLGSPTTAAKCGHQYAAPELEADNPSWSPAADVYGLGATLRALLDPKGAHSHGLEGALTAAMATTPSRRPEAEALVARLEAAVAELQVHRLQQNVWQTIVERAAPDLQKAWFRQVFDKLRPRIEALALGLHSDPYDRAAEIAALLDQVLEAYPAASPALKLGLVKNSNEITGERLAKRPIAFLHGLRLDQAHFLADGRRQRILARFGFPDAAQIRAWTRHGAELIGEVLRLASLPEIIDALL